MAAYLLDSSALVKRYVVEVGSGWVRGLLAPVAGNRIHVAAIADPEVTSALARRARGGSLTAADAAAAITRFRQDLANEYRISDMTPAVILRAGTLAEHHALRGYDAVQLAVALELSDARVLAGLDPLTLVSADAELNAAASAEGVGTEDPNAHP